MNCCNDFGIFRDGPGCAAHRAPPPASCPSSWPLLDKHIDEAALPASSNQVCCNHDCAQGRTCPVRLKNAQILAGLQREVSAQLASLAQAVHGTATPAASAPPEAPYQWLDDLFFKVLSRALLVLSAVIAAGCTGYVYQYFWGP